MVISTLRSTRFFDVGGDAGSRSEKSADDDVVALLLKDSAQLDDREGELEGLLSDRVGGELRDFGVIFMVRRNRVGVRLAGSLHELSW